MIILLYNNKNMLFKNFKLMLIQEFSFENSVYSNDKQNALDTSNIPLPEGFEYLDDKDKLDFAFKFRRWQTLEETRQSFALEGKNGKIPTQTRTEIDKIKRELAKIAKKGEKAGKDIEISEGLITIIDDIILNNDIDFGALDFSSFDGINLNDPRIQPLLTILNEISSHESDKSLVGDEKYNSIYNTSGGNYATRDIKREYPNGFTNLTLKEVMQVQKKFIKYQKHYTRKPPYTGAIGKYQLSQGTLAGLCKKYNIDTNIKFTKDTQDKLAILLMYDLGTLNTSTSRGMSKMKKTWVALQNNKKDVRASVKVIETKLAEFHAKKGQMLAYNM